MAGCDSGIPSTSVTINPTCDADSLTPEAFVNCILNNQQLNKVASSNDAKNMASAAICSAKGADLGVDRSEDPYAMTAIEPEIPDDLDGSLATYKNLQNIMLPLFADTYDDYWNNPRVVLYNPAYQAYASWIANTIVNGESGIPVDLERKLVERAKDRIRADAAMARNSAQNRGSALGWSLPQPFAVAQGEAAEIAAYGALGDASVQLADRQLTIQIESIRFAVEEANKLYLGMERNAIDYIAAWTALLDNIKDLVEIDPNVKANYMNAVSNLYGQRIKKDQIQWMSLNDYYQRIQGDNQLKSSNALSQTDLIVKANTAAAEVMKMLAAAELSQLSTMVTKVATS